MSYTISDEEYTALLNDAYYWRVWRKMAAQCDEESDEFFKNYVNYNEDAPNSEITEAEIDASMDYAIVKSNIAKRIKA